MQNEEIGNKILNKFYLLSTFEAHWVSFRRLWKEIIDLSLFSGFFEFVRVGGPLFCRLLFPDESKDFLHRRRDGAGVDFFFRHPLTLLILSVVKFDVVLRRWLAQPDVITLSYVRKLMNYFTQISQIDRFGGKSIRELSFDNFFRQFCFSFVDRIWQLDAGKFEKIRQKSRRWTLHQAKTALDANDDYKRTSLMLWRLLRLARKVHDAVRGDVIALSWKTESTIWNKNTNVGLKKVVKWSTDTPSTPETSDLTVLKSILWKDRKKPGFAHAEKWMVLSS